MSEHEPGHLGAFLFQFSHPLLQLYILNLDSFKVSQLFLIKNDLIDYIAYVCLQALYLLPHFLDQLPVDVEVSLQQIFLRLVGGLDVDENLLECLGLVCVKNLMLALVVVLE